MNVKYVIGLFALLLLVVPGCAEKDDGNTLATDGAAADELAQYEAELDAVSGDEAFAGEDEDTE